MRSACRFRPCIDLHQGKVKQIVGSSLSDDPSKGPITNFEAEGSSADFAAMYAKDRLLGGHVIKLGPNNEEAALAALRAYPGGLQIGGGVTPANALSYLEAGASHVIVTSYVFSEGRLDAARLAEVVKVVGRERLVLDLSCRRREPGGPFFVVTSGPCVAYGGCVGRPEGYRKDEHCAITVGGGEGGGVLGPCTIFDTGGGDDLTLPDGSLHGGSDCAVGAALAPGETLSWVSDGINQGTERGPNGSGCAAKGTCAMPYSHDGLGGGWVICFV